MKMLVRTDALSTFLTASKLALEQVLQTTKLAIRICSKFEVNHKGGESHRDANPIAMRILLRCESHRDAKPNHDENPILISHHDVIHNFCNKSKND